MSTTLHYVVREPKKANPNPPLLILLHGYGSNENDLFSFANELQDDLLIVSAQAPINMEFGAYSWYAITLDDANEKHSNLDEARTSLQEIDTFITHIQEKYQTRKTFLLGFSQGAILSYAYSFSHPNKVNHVLALSGYINEDLLPIPFSSDELITDYYISHGTVDQVLPVFLAKKSEAFLQKNKLQHQYQEYPIGHGVAPQNFASFKKWIDERL